MKRMLSIRSKLLFLGLVPVIVLGVALFIALNALETFSFDQILADKHASYQRTWAKLVENQKIFLRFSSDLIRQNRPLIQALKSAEVEGIVQQADNSWNQLIEKISVLFFWQDHGSHRVRHWLVKKRQLSYETDFIAPLLIKTKKTRRFSVGFERFPDGKIYFSAVTPYFNAPDKPYNLVVQGVEMAVLTAQLKKMLHIQSVQFYDYPLKDQKAVHLDRDGFKAVYHLPLRNVRGVEIASLELREDLTPLKQAFKWTKQIALVIPTVLVLLTMMVVLAFIKWLIRRLEEMSGLLVQISEDHTQEIIQPEIRRPDELDKIQSAIIHQGNLLKKTYAELMGAWKRRDKEAASRMTINQLLSTALVPISFTQQMEKLLDIIFSVPWFSLHPKGAIFLLDEDSGALVLQAHRGFGRELLQSCRQVPLGYCLCGRAAQNGETLFVSHLDEQHDIHYEGITDHGHYCVPIKSDKKVVGILNLYVDAGHERSKDEDEFLASVAVTLSGLIERRKLEQKVKQQAELDALTGIPNRAFFQERLERAIARAIHTKSEVVLMMIDLDRFKQVNDTLGHKAGDLLLKEVAQRLMVCVRGTDTVARLGGDEFTIIFPKLTHLFYVEFVARRILEEFEKPLLILDRKIDISASIGIAVFPRDAKNQEHLITNADTAMYHAKRDGGATFCFFESQMHVQALARLDMEKALKKALKERELVIYYQPKIALDSGAVVGMEALVRWEKPGEGLISPGVFIPLAEQTGLIVAVGAFVLEEACRQTKQWHDAGYQSLKVSVNLSVRQLRQGERFIAHVKHVLSQTALASEYLELEITESMMMQDMEDALRVIGTLKQLGILISVDDFGTGYSSLGALKNLPIQTLKIDRTFVQNCHQDEDSGVIISTIISLGKQLGLFVVAEGAESAEEVDYLREAGCDEIQGYFFSKPLPTDQFEAYLKAKKRG
ncbi:EAL domain-containing protein [Magnetococcales bacterium HHB-1]